MESERNNKSIVSIFEKGKVDWIKKSAGLNAYENSGSPLPQDTVEAIKEHRIALKGPLTTPVGTGFRSVNVALRQQFNLFSNIGQLLLYQISTVHLEV